MNNSGLGMRFLNSRWMLPKNLMHLSIFGKTRSGKTGSLMSCAQRAYFYGAKILDLYDAGTMENCYWSLKSDSPFWQNREFSYGHQKLKAMEFPVNCLIPMSKDIPTKLPDIFTPFTIPISELTEEDLKAMLGNQLTKNEIALWRTVVDNFTNKTTLTDLLNYIIDAQKRHSGRMPGIHGTGVSSTYNMFSTFSKHKLFSSKSNPLSFNLKDELRNKKVVTSLVLHHFPKELWGFIINHFIYKTFDLVMKKEIKHPVIVIIREAGDFLVNIPSSSVQEMAVRENIIQVLRKGGKHQLYFYIDNQSPLNIDIVKTQMGIKICHLVDDVVELQQALGTLGSMLLTRNDYSTIRTFTPGKCFVLEDRGLFNPQMMPPLTRFSGVEGVYFYDLWLKEKGQRFKNINKELEVIEEEYKESEAKWKQIVNERKERSKIKKELVRAEKEKAKIIKKEIRFTEKRKRGRPRVNTEDPDISKESIIEEKQLDAVEEPSPLLVESQETEEDEPEIATVLEGPEKKEEEPLFC